MTASLDDVAKRAGVSRGAVSQVINGDVRGRISAATKQRVFAAMQELNYQPNRLARALSRGRTDTVGLMISNLRNPFFVELLEHSEHLLREAGYEMLLDSLSLSSPDYHGQGKLRGWNVDGVLMYAAPHESIVDYMGPSAKGLPVVQMGTALGTGDWVAFDIYSGARQAVEYVVSRGRRRLAHVTPCSVEAARQRESMDGRLAACFDVCREEGLSLEIFSIEGEEEIVGGRRVGEAIAATPAAQRPDALLCHNDFTAIGVYHGLRRGGLRVPDDVALVGFDGIRDGQLLDKPLTTVRMPIEIVCRNAVELLGRRIAVRSRGEKASENVPGEPQQIVVPTRLIVGETA